MKKFIFSTLAIISLFIFSCNHPGAVKTESEGLAELPESEIMVYYFHNERRCATCEAVEAETKAALKKYYPSQLKEGEISFISINMEEVSGARVAERFEIATQTLLIVKDDQLKDITNEGFMYARTSPVKLHLAVKKAIDPLLN
jgi:hypothetical protein